MKYKVCDNTKLPNYRFDIFEASTFSEARELLIQQYPDIVNVFIYSYSDDTMEHGFSESHEFKDGSWTMQSDGPWKILKEGDHGFRKAGNS